MCKDVVPKHFTTEKSFVMSLMLMTTTLVELLEMRVVAVWPLIRLSTANCHPPEREDPSPPSPGYLTAWGTH